MRNWDIFSLEKRIHDLETKSSSGGGGTFTRTSLFHSDTKRTTDFDLSDNLENYDLVEIVVETSTSHGHTVYVCDTAYFIDKFKYATAETSPYFLIQPYSGYSMDLTLGADNATNKMHFVTTVTTIGVVDVIGIKTCATPTTVSNVTTKTTRSKKK